MLVVKISPANAGDIRDTGSIPGSGRSPGGGYGYPLRYSYLENPHGQRSLVGYSPWGSQKAGHEQSDLACTSPLITIYQLKKKKKTRKLSPFAALYQGEPSLGKPEYKNKMDAQTNLKFYSEDSKVSCSFSLIVLIGFIESK